MQKNLQTITIEEEVTQKNMKGTSCCTSCSCCVTTIVVLGNFAFFLFASVVCDVCDKKKPFHSVSLVGIVGTKLLLLCAIFGIVVRRVKRDRERGSDTLGVLVCVHHSLSFPGLQHKSDRSSWAPVGLID